MVGNESRYRKHWGVKTTIMDEGHFYQMLYKAPRIYYYEKELATFEDFVATFKTAL